MRSGSIMLMVLCGLAALFYGGEGPAATAQTKTGTAEKKGRVLTAPAVDPKIVAKVRAIAAEILGVKPGDIDIDVPLSKQKAAADELDLVEIVMAVEDAFGIEIGDAELGGTPAEFTGTTSVKTLAGIAARKKRR